MTTPNLRAELRDLRARWVEREVTRRINTHGGRVRSADLDAWEADARAEWDARWPGLAAWIGEGVA